MGGWAPYDCAIVRSLSITKKFDFRKNLTFMGSNLVPSLSVTDAPPTLPLAELINVKKCSLYNQLCLGCRLAGM